MKRISILLAIFLLARTGFAQIVADHTVVDRYDEIPQVYIDLVKKMLVNIGGESHSLGYQNGVNLLELADSRFQVVTYLYDPPPVDTDLHLRLGRPTSYGEDIWTSQDGIDYLNQRMLEQSNRSNPFDVFGFGWCWDMTWGDPPGGTEDPVFGVRWAGTTDGGIVGSMRWGLDAGDQILTGNPVCMEYYLNAIEQYNTFNISNGIPTKAIFTTGPVDSYYAENAVQRELKHDYIRNYIANHPGSILFDYADILCWNNSGEKYTEQWNDGGVLRPYAQIHPDNLLDYDASWHIIAMNDSDGDHIGEVGALRLAKAIWWLLARIAGWNGVIQTTWTGAGSSTWSDPTNWSDGVPDRYNDVTIPVVSRFPVLESGVEAECHNLTIETGAQLTINSSVTGSGSLIVHGTSTGNVVYNLQLPADDLYHYVSPPVSTTTLPSTASFWLYDEPAGNWGNTVTASVSGRGYTTQGRTTLSFQGGVVTSSFSVQATSPYADCDFPTATLTDYSLRTFAQDRDNNLKYGGGGFNLLGNPFTSAMDATAFIGDNGAAFDQNYKALYIYNGSTYSYIGAELTDWENADGQFAYTSIQAGQGFFVAARCNSSLFTFSPGMQTHGTTVPLLKSAKTSSPWPGVELKASYQSLESSALVVYDEKMTRGLDPGYDIGQMNSGSGLSIYTLLASENNGVNFARQALPLSLAGELKVAVGVDFTGGGEVTFSAKTVSAGNTRFWLEDRVTGSFTDLTTKSYTVTLPADTYGSGRFFIIASANTPTAIDQPDVPGDDLRIWVSGRKLIIRGPVSEGSLCEGFDIQGRKLLENKLSDSELNTVDLPAGFHGVLVAKVTDGPVAVTRKVVVL